MEFKEVNKRAIDIKKAYRIYNRRQGRKRWGASEYIQGMMGDLGDLSKLIMAKNNFRGGVDIDKKISHELSDCLWSIMVIADELGVNLEEAFLKTMDELEERTAKDDETH